MRKPLVLALAVALASAGCGTTRSSAGPFVTDLRFAGDRLDVSRCDLVYEVEDHTGEVVVGAVALMIVLLPLALLGGKGGGFGGGGGGGDSKRYSITAESCTETRHAIVERGAP